MKGGILLILRTVHDYRLTTPKAGQWPCLTYFRLFGAEIGGFDLFKLLKAGMPKLRDLELSAVNLTDWNWDGMFEGMRYLEGLQFIRLPSRRGYLQHRGGLYYPHDMDTQTDRSQNQSYEYFGFMETYVIFGGRHPSLPPESEPREADQFLDEFLERFKVSEKCSRQDKIARCKSGWSISDKIGIANNQYALVGGI